MKMGGDKENWLHSAAVQVSYLLLIGAPDWLVSNSHFLFASRCDLMVMKRIFLLLFLSLLEVTLSLMMSAQRHRSHDRLLPVTSPPSSNQQTEPELKLATLLDIDQ